CDRVPPGRPRGGGRRIRPSTSPTGPGPGALPVQTLPQPGIPARSRPPTFPPPLGRRPRGQPCQEPKLPTDTCYLPSANEAPGGEHVPPRGRPVSTYLKYSRASSSVSQPSRE